ncbi:MAG: MurR/RpiR family transcriptional regulator [Sarcina sp.]
MGYKVRIDNRKNDFTDVERKISLYIEGNFQRVINMSVKELAKAVEVSPASIVRFAKMLGYGGYANMKIDIAKGKPWKVEDSSMIIEKSDDVQSIADKLERINRKTLQKTMGILDLDKLIKAIDLIKNAKGIYIYAVGGSGIVALDLSYKFSRINKNCYYNSDTHINMANAAHIGEKDVVIAISYSGETREVIIPVEIAKAKGSRVISIVASGKSTISKLSDYEINMPREEGAIRIGAISSRNSAFIITDLLYLAVASGNMDETMKYIVETRGILDKLKE